MSLRLVWATLAVLILLGAGLRLYKLDEKSLWSDEVATIASAMGNSIDPEAYRLQGRAFDPQTPVPAAEYRTKATRSHGAANFRATAEVLHFNVHPPLFFWLMNLWLHAFGLGGAVMRLPAVLFGIACIPLMFAVGRRLWPRQGDALGLLSAALMALSAYQVSHAQDARQYTLLIFLALIAVWLAMRLVQSEQPAGRWTDWAGLVLALAAGMYSQYFFVTFVGFVFAFLIWKKHKSPAFMKALGLSVLGFILLGLPWLPDFREQLAFLKSAGHYTAGLWNPWQLPEKLWRIFSEFLMQDSRVGRIVPLLIFAVCGLSWLNRWLAARRTGEPLPRWQPELTVLLLWIGMIAGGQIVIDLLKNSHTATIRRYMLLASPAYYLLVGYALLKLRLPAERPWFRQDPALTRRMLIGLTVGLVLFNSLTMLLTRHHSSDEFKQAAAWIAGQYRTGDLVLVNKSGAIAVGMAYYLPDRVPMLGLSALSFGEIQSQAPQMRRLALTQARYQRVWMVFSHSAPSTRTRMAAWFNEYRYRLTGEKKFPGVRVLRYEKAVPEPI